MRAGVVLAVAVLVGCSGGNQTATFTRTVHGAYSRASAVPDTDLMASASAWSGFANTVARADPGGDTAEQGELVDAARQASHAYRARYESLRCHALATLGAATRCPDGTVDAGVYVAQVKTVVDGM